MNLLKLEDYLEAEIPTIKVEVGKEYFIRYFDATYPCRCPCHRDIGKGAIMRHIMPCCYNKSYTGIAKCIGYVCEGTYKFLIHDLFEVEVNVHFITELSDKDISRESYEIININ